MLRTDFDWLEGNIFKKNAYWKLSVSQASSVEIQSHVFVFNMSEQFSHTTAASAKLYFWQRTHKVSLLTQSTFWKFMCEFVMGFSLKG